MSGPFTPKYSPNDPHWIARFDLKGLIAGYNHSALSQASTTDTWTWYSNWTGAAGQLLATVLITYTDSTKATIATVDIS